MAVVVSVWSILPAKSQNPSLHVYGHESRHRAFASRLVCNKCTQLKVYSKNNYVRSGFDPLATSRRHGQLKALDSYFSKLQNDIEKKLSSVENGCDAKESNLVSSFLEGKMMEIDKCSNRYEKKSMLDSLESYFRELHAGDTMKRGTSPAVDQELPKNPVKMSSSVYGGYADKKAIKKANSLDKLKLMDGEASQVMVENTEELQTYDQASDFYLINILVAINIAVFLFEIASPVRNSELEQLSLPVLYGAKINKLILTGEWWRLLTPMFLHSGFPHVALGSWVLLTFGPQVCRGYGPFTFILMYLLGGICGNLTSFLHTPELTVCGTGPVFAIIGAWLVYQIRNKQVLEKEPSDIMLWKAVIATALSYVLSYFGRIDDWTHLGAAFSGIIFGYLTCPTLQMLDNLLSSSKNGEKHQGVAFLQQQADPFKSLVIFMISILIFASLVFAYGPQLEMLEVEGFL